MEIKDRIRELRKKHLPKKLTQDQFAKAINISRSNMGNIETGEVNVTDRLISQICFTFNVNESWLRFGNGDIFLDETQNAITNTNILLNLDSTERQFLEAYLKLEDADRTNLKSALKKIVKNINESNKNTLNISVRPTDEDTKLNRKQKEALIKDQFDEEEKRQTSSASTTTNGSLKKEA